MLAGVVNAMLMAARPWRIFGLFGPFGRAGG